MEPAASDKYPIIPPTYILAERTDQENLNVITKMEKNCWELRCYYNDQIDVLRANIKELKRKIKQIELNEPGSN